MRYFSSIGSIFYVCLRDSHIATLLFIWLNYNTCKILHCIQFWTTLVQYQPHTVLEENIVVSETNKKIIGNLKSPSIFIAHKADSSILLYSIVKLPLTMPVHYLFYFLLPRDVMNDSHPQGCLLFNLLSCTVNVDNSCWHW